MHVINNNYRDNLLPAMCWQTNYTKLCGCVYVICIYPRLLSDPRHSVSLLLCYNYK